MGATAGMLILAFRHNLWLVAAIVAADVVISLFVGDTVIRWEMEQLRTMLNGE